MVAASGGGSAELAAEIGDGLIGTAPDAELVSAFRDRPDGDEAHAYAELTVCWSEDADEGLRIALERWPNAGLPGTLSAELATPADFEQAATLVRAGDLRGSVVTGPDPEPYIDLASTYARAGYDGVWFHQVGVDQEGFTAFARKELLSAVNDL